MKSIFDVSIKSTGLRKQALEHAKQAAIKEVTERIKRIAPTVFPLECNKVEIETEISIGNRILRGFETKVVTLPYKQVSDYVLQTLVTIDSKTARLLSYIIRHLNWQSNVVLIDDNNMPEVSTSRKLIRESLSVLDKMNLVKKTDDDCIIVINHNEMFFGSKTKFIEEYNECYLGKLAITTKGGKIIL